jgi:23S rRNA (guanine745-N1)-methyltransferase
VSVFLCPKCRTALTQTGNSLKCDKGHCFDISSEGYVNLVLGKTSGGDSPDMYRARHDFLNTGYYEPFAKGISTVIKEFSAVRICDAGCGEGYYSRVIKSENESAEIVGFDLAKTSIKLAAKAEKGKSSPINYAVCGIFDMPLSDNSYDALISVFAPIPDKEALRILKDGGIMIVCHPGKDHLSGLKALVYDNPYDNEETDAEFSGFEKIRDERVKYSVTVSKEHISSLFLMTLYYWKTSVTDAEKLKYADKLETELDFIISIYRK